MAFQDFDKISQRVQQQKQQKVKKKITIAVVASVIAIVAAAAVCVFAFRSHHDSPRPEVQTNHVQPSPQAQKDNSKTAPVVQNNPQPAPEVQNNKPQPTPEAQNNNPPPTPSNPIINIAEKEVKTVCAGTDYVQTCEESLLKAMNNNASPHPKDTIIASFTVLSEEIEKVIKQASADLKFDTPFKKAAFDDCLSLLNDAKEELNSTVSSIEGIDLDKVVSIASDMNNWMSAVLSYQQTCIDGFPDGDQDKAALEKMLKNGKELGSNALAIVSQVGSIVEKFQLPDVKSRKLLVVEDEGIYPGWMNRENMRMLKKADTTNLTPNVTVAKDGSGNFTTVSAALSAMPKDYIGRYVIYVKEGVYEENVVVAKNMVNVTIYGDGSQKSVITGSKNYVDGVPTFQTATFAALGEGFMAQSIGFRNTAGPEKHQAVALRVQSDRSIFLNCRMEGYQDTLYAQTHRQFYRSCYITGTVDFIFGDAAAVFQNCMMYVRTPLENQQTAVTAQGRVDKRETTGFVIQNSHILADEKLEHEKGKFKSYLGRPWKEYSRTIVMESQIGDLIQPEGWLEWSGNFALNTLYYAEFNNKGPGANTSGRVKWAGYKVINREEAMNFTVGPFVQGDSWLKNPNIPVRFGMYT
ncbi:hypothetical protein BUALT_Bualt09G0046900 [Buddleja alternifolia]|uniref:Pectinesterase n=1 Tax=Buddleja alternifolia TaxID=168488 RepID=A0AAV6X0L4_9LAMI|nr:hypothetical protein BUALT_Bualt09G0046900 [Buddleja alternifolia]